MARTKGALGKKRSEFARAMDKAKRDNPHYKTVEECHLDLCNNAESESIKLEAIKEHNRYKYSPPAPQREETQEQNAFEFTWVDDPLNAADKPRAN